MSSQDTEIGRELKAMSEWLDAHRAPLGLVAEDLRRDGVRATGRQGCRRRRSCAAPCPRNTAS